VDRFLNLTLEGFVLPGELVQMRLQRHEANLLSSF
jgi:hypothetical protein